MTTHAYCSYNKNFSDFYKKSESTVHNWDFKLLEAGAKNKS